MAPLITDLPIVILALVASTTLTNAPRVLALISLAGGLYLIYLAWETARTPSPALDTPQDQPHSIRRAATVNALSPHPYLFWATVGAPFALKARQHGLLAPLAFVGGFYLLLVTCKMTLALATAKSRTLLTGSKVYSYTMRLLAAALLLFALILFRDAWRLFAGA